MRNLIVGWDVFSHPAACCSGLNVWNQNQVRILFQAGVKCLATCIIKCDNIEADHILHTRRTKMPEEKMSRDDIIYQLYGWGAFWGWVLGMIFAKVYQLWAS